MTRDFRFTTFPPASVAEIEAAEAEFGVAFLPEYKAFLQRDNGLEFRDYFGASEECDWIYQIMYLVGVSPLQKPNFSWEVKGLDRRWLKLFYPLGDDGGGNQLVHICAGRHAGQLAMIDHGVWFGGTTQLLEVRNGFYPDDDEEQHPLPFQTFAQASADQIFDECFKQGFLTLYPMTFDEYLAKMEALYNRLTAEARAKPEAPVPSEAKIDSAYLCVFDLDDERWKAAEKLAGFYGDRFFIAPGQALGWRYETKMKETRDLSVHIVITAPDGAEARNTVRTIESNATFQFTLPLGWPDEPKLSGVYKIDMDFPEEKDLPALSDSCDIVIARRRFAFTAAQFLPAEESAIAPVEKTLGYPLRADFKHWLQTENGLDFFWPYIPLWNVLDEEAFEAFETEIKKIRQERWELGIHEISGLHGEARSYDSFDRVVERRARSPHLRFVYPVAQTYLRGCEGYGQIAAGARAGQIVEFREADFILDQLSKIENGRRVVGKGKKAETRTYPFASFAEASADQIIDAWIEEGMIRLMNMDFAAFAAHVVAVHESEYARLAQAYLGDDAPTELGEDPPA